MLCTVLCYNLPLVFINTVSSSCIYCVSSPVRFYSCFVYFTADTLPSKALLYQFFAHFASFVVVVTVGVGSVDRELASQLLQKQKCIDQTDAWQVGRILRVYAT